MTSTQFNDWMASLLGSMVGWLAPKTRGWLVGSKKIAVGWLAPKKSRWAGWHQKNSGWLVGVLEYKYHPFLPTISFSPPHQGIA